MNVTQHYPVQLIKGVETLDFNEILGKFDLRHGTMPLLDSTEVTMRGTQFAKNFDLDPNNLAYKGLLGERVYTLTLDRGHSNRVQLRLFAWAIDAYSRDVTDPPMSTDLGSLLYGVPVIQLEADMCTNREHSSDCMKADCTAESTTDVANHNLIPFVMSWFAEVPILWQAPILRVNTTVVDAQILSVPIEVGFNTSVDLYLVMKCPTNNGGTTSCFVPLVNDIDLLHTKHHDLASMLIDCSVAYAESSGQDRRRKCSTCKTYLMDSKDWVDSYLLIRGYSCVMCLATGRALGTRVFDNTLADGL